MSEKSCSGTLISERKAALLDFCAVQMLNIPTRVRFVAVTDSKAINPLQSLLIHDRQGNNLTVSSRAAATGEHNDNARSQRR